MLPEHHVRLLARDRSFALRAAIRAAVQPGSSVLDAGTGTGVLAVWAAQAGAARVVGVDREHVDLARALVAANGYADAIQLLDADLATLELPGAPRFDLVTALIYDNDPRRDETRSALVYTLRDRFLAPGGRMLPDRVRYHAHVVDWPEQDITTYWRDLDARVGTLSAEHGIDFRTLRDAIRSGPARELFPRRCPDGRLERPGARLLSGPTPFGELDYRAAPRAYPERLTFEVASAGTMNAVLFVQELFFERELLFRNESISWLSEPLAVTAGDRPDVVFDAGWRSTNVARVEVC